MKRYTTRQTRRRISKLCQRPKEDFARLGATIETQDGPLTYIDNGSKILAVAHLDTVGHTTPTWSGDTVYCPQLDDRLGVWTLLDLLPSLGCVPFDILLTDSEEVGHSTAQYFTPERQYNWMFSFDRAGTDAVMYEYEDDEAIDLVTTYGWRASWGSFSDICSLDFLGIKGFNFGTGYHDQHTTKCSANIRDTIRSAELFVDFANDLANRKLEYHPETRWSGFDPKSYPREDERLCWNCNENVDDQEWIFCPFCGRMIQDY